MAETRPEGANRDEVVDRQRQRRMETCKHWRGALEQPPCGAGIDLIERAGPRRQSGWARKISCTSNPEPVFVCERKAVPTPEEVEAEEAEFAESLKHTFTVMKAIPADKTILRGEMPCPKCGGTVQWARSSYNGHLRAACKRGCVSFME